MVRQFDQDRSVLGSGDVQAAMQSMAIGSQVEAMKESLNRPLLAWEATPHASTFMELATHVQAHGPNQVDMYGVPFTDGDGQAMAATLAGVGFIYNDGFCQKGYGGAGKNGLCGAVPYRNFINAHQQNVTVPIGNTLNTESVSNNWQRGFTVRNMNGVKRAPWV